MRKLIWVAVGVVLLCLLPMGHAQETWRGSYRDQQGFPFTERWEGTKSWRPNIPPGSYRPDRLIIDRPGKCEVRCQRSGREYRCREYRC